MIICLFLVLNIFSDATHYDYLENGGICFAEWCEKIEPYLPERYYTVTIRKSAENPDKRMIVISEAETEF